MKLYIKIDYKDRDEKDKYFRYYASSFFFKKRSLSYALEGYLASFQQSVHYNSKSFDEVTEQLKNLSLDKQVNSRILYPSEIYCLKTRKQEEIMILDWRVGGLDIVDCLDIY